MPAVDPPKPDYPMQLLSSDYFYYAGKTYLLIVDRYSNWPVIKLCKDETAEELVRALREFFCQFGTPEQLASDGGSVYTSATTQGFLKTWGVQHRISSAYNPRSNLRAETAVKSMKRLIQENVGPSGTLNTDQLAMALLTYRNTPDRDTDRSPAQILFARNLRDAIPCRPGALKLRKEWILTTQAREAALARRHEVRAKDLNSKAHPLHPLALGDIVQVQNQAGTHPNKWDKSGTIVEVQAHDAYLIKFDGSGRISKRNRRFLRPIIPFNDRLSGSPRNSGGPPDDDTGYFNIQDNQSHSTNNFDNFANSNNTGTAGTRAEPGPRERAQYPPPPDQDDHLQQAGHPTESRSTTPDDVPDPQDPSEYAAAPSPPRRHPVLDSVLCDHVQRPSPPRRQDTALSEPFEVADQLDDHEPTDHPQPATADYTSVPAAPAQSNRTVNSRAATPQPCTQPPPQPQLGKRVRFKPQKLVVGDPNHPYWRAHHARPRIPPVRGEGR